MKIKKLLLAASAAAVLAATGASAALADDWHDRGAHHDMDRHDDRRDGDRHDHDRYWRPELRGGYVDRDRVFFELRRHHYDRFIGDPYWVNGRYVVKAFRNGHVVFVEVNPYTAVFVGEIRL
ncbi:MAG: hypothetical protein WCA81_15015 [Rhizomicrobium sp.]